MELVTYTLEGSIALIGLNRTDKRNAMNDEMILAIKAAVERASEEADVGILHAHGEHFSAGLDLGEALQRAARPMPRKRKRHEWHVAFDAISRGPIPWLAVLHGAVIGGGLELASAAHIRVADETAFFGLPEGQRGIFVGGGGTVRIQRIVGYSVMADMMLTGRLLSAREAEAVHIARYVVEKGAALDKARELAQRIAGNTTETNWKIVNVLPRVNDLSHDDGLFMEYLTSNLARSSEAQSRLQAFLDGRAAPLRRPEGES